MAPDARRSLAGINVTTMRPDRQRRPTALPPRCRPCERPRPMSPVSWRRHVHRIPRYPRWWRCATPLGSGARRGEELAVICPTGQGGISVPSANRFAQSTLLGRHDELRASRDSRAFCRVASRLGMDGSRPAKVFLLAGVRRAADGSLFLVSW